MLLKLIFLIVSFITGKRIAKTPEPVEAWHFGWFLSSDEIEDNRKRAEVRKRLNDQKNADLLKLIDEAEEYVRDRKERERERRRQEFVEWVDNCNQIFKPANSYAA